MRRKFTAREAEAAGARALLYRADVSDDAGVRAMLAATEKEFGRLDVLINNAGTTVDVEPKNFEAMTVEDLESSLRRQCAWSISRHPRRDAAPKKIAQRLHRQHLQHRRSASERAAVTVCREQSGGGQL